MPLRCPRPLEIDDGLGRPSYGAKMVLVWCTNRAFRRCFLCICRCNSGRELAPISRCLHPDKPGGGLSQAVISRVSLQVVGPIGTSPTETCNLGGATVPHERPITSRDNYSAPYEHHPISAGLAPAGITTDQLPVGNCMVVALHPARPGGSSDSLAHAAHVGRGLGSVDLSRMRNAHDSD